MKGGYAVSPAPSIFHKAQLVEITPEVIGELLSLEKTEITYKNKLPFGNWKEYESNLKFDGRTLKFLCDGEIIYFCDTVEEIGGLAEYAYLVSLGKHATYIGCATDYLASAVGVRTARRKKLLEESDRICKGIAALCLRNMHNEELNKEFEKLKNDAKRFVRKGQQGYNLALVQILETKCKEKPVQIIKAKNKIEAVAEKLLAEKHRIIEKANIENTERKTEKKKCKVVRLKSSEQVEKIYSSETEILEQSELESIDVIEQEPIENSEEKKVLKLENQFETESKKHFEMDKKKDIIINIEKKETRREENEKSNSEGLGRY